MTLKKNDFIAKYGEDAYERVLEQARTRYHANPEKEDAHNRKIHPEICRKGGRYYDKHLKYQHTGIPGEKNKIRMKHAREYYPLKMIIAPDSQIHHEWIPQTAEYRGMALVEAKPHRYGIIDVIEILDGEITLLTEEEIKNQEPMINIPHTEAIELIRNIRTKKDNLDMEMVDWIDWSEEVVGMLCDMFDIKEEEVNG